VSRGTAIEWTDATWNPTRGCSRISEGCRNCYAEKIATRFSAPGRPFAGFAKRPNATRHGERPGWTGTVALVPEKLDEPLRWRKPQRIFVDSMSDLFHEELSDVDVARTFAVMALCYVMDKGHAFQVLTKRPLRMRRLLDHARFLDLVTREMKAIRPGLPGENSAPRWPLPNVWLGVSVENEENAWRLVELLDTPAAIRFASYEPALGPVEFRLGDTSTLFLDWIVVGGESGPGARPMDLEWARSAVRQAKAAGVPVFVKQLGTHWATHRFVATQVRSRTVVRRTGVGDSKGGDVAVWPEDLRVREFPR
jgi:protein gp37